MALALLDLTAPEAPAFFADTDAEELVAAVRSAGDEELLRLIRDEEVRSAAVAGIIARLHEYAVPERLAAARGVVRLDLRRGSTLLERHALRFADGEISHDDDPEGPADVVLTTSVLRFVRLVSGQLNAGLDYLAGKLDIDGDTDLALAVGGLFRVPGTDRVAVDPTLLDPVEVAVALGEAPAAHLRKVMASGFRPVVLGEIFRRLPDFVDEKKASRTRLTVGFRLLGNPSGEVERYVVHVRDGMAYVETGDAGSEDRDATVTCQGHDYLRLATGHLSPVLGVLKGQLKVRGSKAKALELASIIDIPSAG